MDFSKAFDSISRDKLLNKLQNIGVHGKFFEIIQNIYSNDINKVKIGNKCSASFKPNRGVRQGCVLSPLLFNIFLADFQTQLDICNDNVQLDDNKKISCFLYGQMT